MQDITVNIVEEPVQVTVSEEVTQVAVQESPFSIEITETPIDVIISNQEIVIELPDPNKVGPKGQKGDAGTDGIDAGTVYAPAASTLLAYRAVYLNSVGKAIPASSSDLTSLNKVVGINIQAALQDEIVTIRIDGEIENPAWDFVPGSLLYLGPDGLLTQNQTGLYSQYLGYAITNSKIFLRPGRAIIRG